MSKDSSPVTPSALLSAARFFLLACFHSLLAALPQQVPHDWYLLHLGVSKAIRLHLHSFTQWYLWTSIQGQPWHVSGLSGFIPKLLYFILSSKARSCSELPSSAAYWGWNMPSSPFNYIFTSFLSFTAKLDCPETWSLEQAGLRLRDPPASAFPVLGIKACTIIAQ